MSTPYILDILCQYGYSETAWKVLLQEECPSWLYEIRQGATTIWENWDAVRPDGERAGCSFNHYAFGCVGDFLYRRVLGLQNAGTGYDRILISPEYSCPLTGQREPPQCKRYDPPEMGKRRKRDPILRTDSGKYLCRNKAAGWHYQGNRQRQIRNPGRIVKLLYEKKQAEIESDLLLLFISFFFI